MTYTDKHVGRVARPRRVASDAQSHDADQITADREDRSCSAAGRRRLLSAVGVVGAADRTPGHSVPRTLHDPLHLRRLALKDNEEFLKVLAKRARLGVDGERRDNAGGLYVDV